MGGKTGRVTRLDCKCLTPYSLQHLITVPARDSNGYNRLPGLRAIRQMRFLGYSIPGACKRHPNLPRSTTPAGIERRAGASVRGADLRCPPPVPFPADASCLRVGTPPLALADPTGVGQGVFESKQSTAVRNTEELPTQTTSRRNVSFTSHLLDGSSKPMGLWAFTRWTLASPPREKSGRRTRLISELEPSTPNSAQ